MKTLSQLSWMQMAECHLFIFDYEPRFVSVCCAQYISKVSFSKEMVAFMCGRIVDFTKMKKEKENIVRKHHIVILSERLPPGRCYRSPERMYIFTNFICLHAELGHIQSTDSLSSPVMSDIYNDWLHKI